MKRNLKFLGTFKPSMLDGVKTQTARYRICGWPGETFEAFGAVFQFAEVTNRHLGLVIEKDFVAEGFSSPEEFEAIWVKLHPRRGFQPNDRVWVHRFRLLGERK